MNEMLINLLGGNQLVEGITKQTGISQNEAASVLGVALPTLLGAMQKNSQTPQAAEGLLGALQSSKHDGSLVENIGTLFGQNNQNILSDGAGILGHLLGGNTQNIANNISSQTGVASGTVSTILQTLAPLLMSYLGKQVSQNNVSSSSALTSILGSVMGGNNAGTGGILGSIASMIDQDKDGNPLNDLMGMFGKK